MTVAASSPLRRMEAEDLDAVLAIQLACYGAAFVEGRALIERRLARAPETAWVALVDGRVQAYLTGYPSTLGKLTALHGEFEPHPLGDTLYLHDLAVHPDANGRRLGPRLVQHALAFGATQGWPHAALVSVQDSLGFWQRWGFENTALTQPEQITRLASYPGAAFYMTRHHGAA